MIARSQRIELRPYLAGDFDSWLTGNLWRKKKQNEFDTKPQPRKNLTRAFFNKRKRNLEKRAAERSCFIFGIFHRHTGEHLGVIDLYIISPRSHWANLGYLVLNQHWGNGFGPEAASLALEIAFKQLDLLRVEASCELHNKASARVALKAGMFEEGLRRKYPIPAGMKDLYVFGMNSVDFKKRKRR